MSILKSASKVVFLLLATAACFGFIYGIVTKTIIFEPKDFMVLAGMAFGFYFAHKGDPKQPFAGK